jgi:hypothetical protein
MRARQPDGETLPKERRFVAKVQFCLDSLGPTASDAELREVTWLNSILQRYLAIGTAGVAQSGNSDDLRQVGLLKTQLLAAFEAGDPDTVFAVGRELAGTPEGFGRHSLHLAPADTSETLTFAGTSPLPRLV